MRSLGGEYLSVEAAEVEVSATGYAKEMSDDYNERAAQLYAEQVEDVDIVITTALIPGRPAPRLITAEMVASMKAGSVIVDMAAANGGNVEGVVADQAVVSDNGVTIIGYTDLAGRLPTQASQLYATNLVNLMKLMTPGKDGRLVLDFDDSCSARSPWSATARSPGHHRRSRCRPRPRPSLGQPRLRPCHR